jgi:hypothetical protein
MAHNHRSPNLEDSVGAIKRLASIVSDIFLCFDALDELPTMSQNALLKILYDLCRDSSIKVLITSRDHISLTPRPLNLSEFRITATLPDLQRYLESRIDKAAAYTCLGEQATPTSPLRNEIITEISSRARGMFLLAELQINQLEEALSEREIRTQLKALPHEIDDQYTSYIERIKANRHGQLGLDAIQWIHRSHRLLSAVELQEALSVQKGDTKLDKSGMVSIDAILTLAGGLLTLEPETKTV